MGKNVLVVWEGLAKPVEPFSTSKSRKADLKIAA